MGVGGTRKSEAIANNGDADAVDFGLGGADGGHHACVGYLAISGDGSFLTKKSVGAGRHAGTNVLGNTSEVVGKGVNPSGSTRATNQMAILKGLADDGVDDKVCLFDSDDMRKGSNKTRLGGRTGTSGARKTRAQIVTGGADWIVRVGIDESGTGGWCRHHRSLYRGGWSGDNNWHPRR